MLLLINIQIILFDHHDDVNSVQDHTCDEKKKKII